MSRDVAREQRSNEPRDETLPTEACPNPECADTTLVEPVRVTEIPSGLGLTFHCGTCPCRWYTPYSFVTEAAVADGAR